MFPKRVIIPHKLLVESHAESIFANELNEAAAEHFVHDENLPE